MKKRNFKGKREANTMMALVCAATVQLTGPQAHADIILDGYGSIEADEEHANVYLGGGNGDGTLEVFDGVLNVTNELKLGLGFHGDLTVFGGTVNAVTSYIGDNERGEVDVRDSGTLNTDTLMVGFNGKGYVTVNNGGTLNTDTLMVGFNGMGYVTVNNGGTLNTKTLMVGINNDGTLNILNGGTVTVSGDLTSASWPSSIYLAGTLQIGTGGTTGTLLGGTGDLWNEGTLIFKRSDDSFYSGILRGPGTVVKQGTGTLTLSGASLYSGGTTISTGTLEVSGASGALTATSAVNVNGGTLLLSGSDTDRISNAATVSLGAATASKLQLSGTVTETLGAMTLAAGAGTRVIDFGSGSGLLTLASLTAASSLPVQIWNWSGTIGTGGGTDRLLITGGATGLSGLSTSDISFYSDSGISRYTGATMFSGSELVPVPEASTLLGVLGLMAPLAWRERRHWRRCRAAVKG